MKPLNGPGASVSFIAAFITALLAECIPALLIGLCVILGACAWDIAHGNWVGNKNS